MLLRLLLSAGLLCGVSAADVNPLSLKAPRYPTLPVPGTVIVSRLPKLPCSVPLLEYKAPTDKQFFIRHLKPPTTAQDSTFSKPAPSQPCN